MWNTTLILVMAGLAATAAWGQQAQAPAPAEGANFRPNYTLGPDDQILVRAPNADEINEKPFRIESDGTINLPLVGRIRAAGMTVTELEAELKQLLRKYLREPVVQVNIVQFRGDPVFMLGAFRSPGIYPLRGRHTLVEMMATSGGLQPNAGQTIRVTRKKAIGPIPLPTAIEDAAAGTTYVEINMARLIDSVNPAEDIVLEPYDVITATRTVGVFVNGEVIKPGSVDLPDTPHISVAQLISQAGGLTREADGANVTVLRPVLQSNQRARIPVNVKKVLAGEAKDVPVLPGDVVNVPRRPDSFLGKLKTPVLIVVPPLVTAVIFQLIQR